MWQKFSTLYLLTDNLNAERMLKICDRALFLSDIHRLWRKIETRFYRRSTIWSIETLTGNIDQQKSATATAWCQFYRKYLVIHKIEISRKTSDQDKTVDTANSPDLNVFTTGICNQLCGKYVSKMTINYRRWTLLI